MEVPAQPSVVRPYHGLVLLSTPLTMEIRGWIVNYWQPHTAIERDKNSTTNWKSICQEVRMMYGVDIENKDKW